MKNPCNEIQLGELKECVLPDAFIQEIINTLLDGSPHILIITADEKELADVRRRITMALPVGIMRYAKTDSRFFTWDNQVMQFCIYGDTLQKHDFQPSTFWTEKACQVSGYDPDSDEATMGDHNLNPSVPKGQPGSLLSI